MTVALMAVAMMTGVAVVVVKMTVVMSKALKVFKEGGFTEVFEEGRGD